MLARLQGVKQVSHPEATVYDFRFVDSNNGEVDTGEAFTLTGYEIPLAGGAVADTDSLLAAIGKLEFRIDALENP